MLLQWLIEVAALLGLPLLMVLLTQYGSWCNAVLVKVLIRIEAHRCCCFLELNHISQVYSSAGTCQGKLQLTLHPLFDAHQVASMLHHWPCTLVQQAAGQHVPLLLLLLLLLLAQATSFPLAMWVLPLLLVRPKASCCQPGVLGCWGVAAAGAGLCCFRHPTHAAW